MANSSRRYIDKNGNMFIPMNVEGGTWDEHFINTKKLVFIGGMLAALFFIITYLSDLGASWKAYVAYISIWAVISFYITRFVVFEEKYYYKMYKQLIQSEVTTPAIFWDIASIKDTPEGAILTYSDTKIGILMQLDRDTITGKAPDFKEEHYDAISDFYNELVFMKYNFVQMNVMETAGNDPRLDSLDKLVYKSDNPNISKLMELEVGHIKNITHSTLYESDYILIYTSELSKVDYIISDAINCALRIMDGAYINYKILNSREIIEFVKERYGVKYFNYVEATLDMYKLNGVQSKKPFDIIAIKCSDGETYKLDNQTKNKIHAMTSDVLSGAVQIENISIIKTLSKRNRKSNLNGVDFEQASKGLGAISGKSNTTSLNYGHTHSKNIGSTDFGDLSDFDIGFPESMGTPPMNKFNRWNKPASGKQNYSNTNNSQAQNQSQNIDEDDEETIDF